jgi:hypothetical protein
MISFFISPPVYRLSSLPLLLRPEPNNSGRPAANGSSSKVKHVNVWISSSPLNNTTGWPLQPGSGRLSIPQKFYRIFSGLSNMETFPDYSFQGSTLK